MKKLLSLALAVGIAATLPLSVAAAETNASLGQTKPSQDISVSAKYQDSTTTNDVISVSVEWGAMQFTYLDGGTKVWNPDDHSYSVSSPNHWWDTNGNTVKVVNHSNVAVKASFTYAAESGSGLTGAFTYNNDKTADAQGAISLQAGEVNNKDGADHVTATLTLSGKPANSLVDYTKVGKVTVSVSQ